MISEFLQKIGLKRKPNLVTEDFQITVFLMSEGTAQGQPRPLQVCKETVSWTQDKNKRWELSPYTHVLIRVREIIKYGYETTQANGLKVTFAPHRIYKVTWEKVENDVA